MRAGFYECDVTPPIAGFMWGHYRPLYALDVHERLYAKAAVIENDGNTVAIVAVDTCTLPPEMHDIVTKRVHEYTGIPADNICISSTHTHTGAPVSDGLDVGCLADASYKDVFFRLTADAVIHAYRRLEEVELTFAEPLIAGISYCRNHELENGTLITHGGNRLDVVGHLAEPDRHFPILYFKNGDRVLGTISSFACHLDTIGAAHFEPGYSGDYASILSKRLKESYGKEFVSVFLIGCAGDINTSNPSPNAKHYNYIEIGNELARVVCTQEKYAKPVTAESVRSIKESVTINTRFACDQIELNKKLSASLLENPNPVRVRNALHYLAANTKSVVDLFVQGILIGDIFFAVLPGEIFTNTGKAIKSASPFGRTVVVENSNSYCGYVPPEEYFCENNNLYETSLAFHSCLAPEAATIFINKTIDIASKF